MKKQTIFIAASLSFALMSGLAQEGEPAAAQDLVTIEQPQMTANILAAHYKEFTGKRVIISSAAQAKVISLVSPGEMTKAEAAELLEKACLLEGLVFVPAGVDQVKLVLSQNAKNQGLPYIVEKGLLPAGDVVVSYLMKFDHIAPTEALRAFQSIVGAVKPHGSITTVENANAIIIAENTSLIRTLIKIKDSIDIPQSSVSRKMLQLEHADAEILATQLQGIIDTQLEQRRQVARSSNTPANQRNATPASTPNGGAAERTTPNNTNAESTGDIQSVNVIPDVRTNSIFVMGRPIDLVFVESLVKDFDQPIKIKNFYKHRLEYLPVSEFLPILETGIRQVMGESLFEAEQAGGANANRQGNQNNSDGSFDGEERSELPEALLVGKTLLVADNINNTLIVQGPPQSIEVAKNLIKNMDISGPQVQITAVFGRYSMTGETSLGVDFARTSSGSTGGRAFAGQSGTGFPIVVSPNSLTSPELLPTAIDAIAGLSLYGQVSDNFFAFLRALQSDGKFKLLSKPTLFTTNNNQALFSSGQRIAVPTSTLSTGTTDTSVTQNTNIEFRDVLLRLEVVPLVNSDDEVTLQISFLNDNVVGSQTINGNSIPTIGTEEIVTTVKVPNNGTIALGGIITERSEENKTGVPVLSSIPGLGKLFSSTSKDTTKEELVILIQPRIIQGRKELSRLNDFNARKSDIIDSENGTILLPQLDSLSGKKKSTRNGTPPKEETVLPQAPQEDKKRQVGNQSSPRNRFRGTRR